MPDKQQVLEIQLNPARLSQIINAAVIECNEIVNFHFNALATADLNEYAKGAEERFRVQGPSQTADDRKRTHEAWILAKAFQDLLRAIRHSLEEAHLFLSLLTKHHRIPSDTTLAAFLNPLRRKAASMQFPDLLEAVNKTLTSPLSFSSAYGSLQIARNCLEHRAGIVSKIETHGKENFTLHVPRMKIFYLRNGEEIELQKGAVIEPEDGQTHAQVLMRIETRDRIFKLGDRLAFTLAQFNEITFACFYLGQQLVTRLPKPIQT